MKKGISISLALLSGLAFMGFTSTQQVLAKGTTKLSVNIPDGQSAQYSSGEDDSVTIKVDNGTFTFSGKTNPNAKVTIERQDNFDDYKTTADSNGNFSKKVKFSNKSKKKEFSVTAKSKDKDDSDDLYFTLINNNVSNSSSNKKSKSSSKTSKSELAKTKVKNTCDALNEEMSKHSELDGFSMKPSGDQFKVTVPSSATGLSDNEQKSLYKSVVDLIYSYDNGTNEGAYVEFDGSDGIPIAHYSYISNKIKLDE